MSEIKAQWTFTPLPCKEGLSHAHSYLKCPCHQTNKQKMHLLASVHNIHNTEAKGQKQLNKHLPVKHGGRQQYPGTLEAKTEGSIVQAHV